MRSSVWWSGEERSLCGVLLQSVIRNRNSYFAVWKAFISQWVGFNLWGKAAGIPWCLSLSYNLQFSTNNNKASSVWYLYQFLNYELGWRQDVIITSPNSKSQDEKSFWDRGIMTSEGWSVVERRVTACQEANHLWIIICRKPINMMLKSPREILGTRQMLKYGMY